MAYRGPNRDPWDPPRPRAYPPRPAGRPGTARRWPITPAAGKTHPHLEEDDE